MPCDRTHHWISYRCVRAWAAVLGANNAYLVAVCHPFSNPVPVFVLVRTSLHTRRTPACVVVTSLTAGRVASLPIVLPPLHQTPTNINASLPHHHPFFVRNPLPAPSSARIYLYMSYLSTNRVLCTTAGIFRFKCCSGTVGRFTFNQCWLYSVYYFCPTGTIFSQLQADSFIIYGILVTISCYEVLRSIKFCSLFCLFFVFADKT